MKKLILAALVVLTLASCTNTELREVKVYYKHIGNANKVTLELVDKGLNVGDTIHNFSPLRSAIIVK